MATTTPHLALSEPLRWLLKQMRDSGHEWHRPMDLGGRNGSGHSGRLRRLINMGLAERKPRGAANGVLRGSYWYRITDAGRAALEASR